MSEADGGSLENQRRILSVINALVWTNVEMKAGEVVDDFTQRERGRLRPTGEADRPEEAVSSQVLRRVS